jgi:5-methylcytosine-specific restriction endonuclease McrA
VRRAVWARDGGQCTFVGAEGRCSERGFLEFHHRLPFAAGGGATIENVALLCRAHNGHEAERFFGRAGP